MKPGSAQLIVIAFATATIGASRLDAANDFAGERLKVIGPWSENQIQANRVQRKGAGKDPQIGKITGRIDRVDAKAQELVIGPIRVTWSDRSAFEGLTSKSMAVGRTISATGRIVGARLMAADTIEPATDLAERRYVELSGAVASTERRADGSRVMSILGVSVVARPSLLNQASELTRNPNDRRPTQQLTVSLFGRPLTIGGEIGTNPRYRRGLALDDDPKDERVRVEQALQLELRYPLSDDNLVFVKTQAGYGSQFRPSEPSNVDTEWTSDRGEGWIYLGHLGVDGLSAQIGRQRFFEEREWWWDKDLDAVRLRFDRQKLHTEIALAKELAPRQLFGKRAIDPEERGVRRVLAQAAYSVNSNHRIDAFYLSHDDRSGSAALGAVVPDAESDLADAKLRWVGARASGRFDTGSFGRLRYHLDVASVRGDETRVALADTPVPFGQGTGRVAVARVARSVSGSAFDAGASWTFELPGEPTLTFGRAHGSQGFRQTNLHRNNAKFGGVDRFRYYGELARPELSNLDIWTGALGSRIFKSSSIEVLGHRYAQPRPADTFAGTPLDRDPAGFDAALGHEWDVVLGIQEWERFDIELIGGRFVAGPAFGSAAGRKAHTIIAKIDVNF